MTSVRLLIDENLSEAILTKACDLFPDSRHVRRELGDGTADLAIWDHAQSHGLVLLTRDEDFARLSTLRGPPPKVIWLDAHNLANREVVAILTRAKERIERFVADPTLALLALSK